MMKLAVAGLLVLTLGGFPALAAEKTGPLAPGKPAGTKEAQLRYKKALWITGASAAAIVVILLATSGDSATSTSGT